MHIGILLSSSISMMLSETTGGGKWYQHRCSGTDSTQLNSGSSARRDRISGLPSSSHGSFVSHESVQENCTCSRKRASYSEQPESPFKLCISVFHTFYSTNTAANFPFGEENFQHAHPKIKRARGVLDARSER